MLQEGLCHVSTLIVSDADTAIAIGSGDLPVLATPRMMALMENAAMLAVAGEMAEWDTTVGGHIESTHLAPTPVGAEVEARAMLAKVDGKKLHFAIAVYENGHLLGKGTHIRYIVNRARFMEKCLASASR